MIHRKEYDMKRIVNAVKLATLLGALAIVGLTSTTTRAEAKKAVECGGHGHSCHAKINGELLHLKWLV